MENTQMQPLDISKDVPAVIENNNQYKENLKQLPEVERLTNEINIMDSNSILEFGQSPSDGISKMSDQLLSSMKGIKTEEVGQMLVNLTKIMDKFDIKEIESPEKAEGILTRLFNKAKDSVDKLFQKYDDMGKEVDKIYMLLKQYEKDIRKTNDDLVMQYDENVKYFEQLEKYIVAGGMAIEEIDQVKVRMQNDPNINPQELPIKLQQLDIAKDMLSQRIYDLQIAENVAMQTCPMIQTMQMSNFNLLRKINSSFIITLPIFKQCLVQAIQLKRQEIQAKSIQQLDEKTNELLLRNAQNTAAQSVNIARMAGGSSIKIETLQSTYETIKNGIEETRQISNELAAKRTADMQTLSTMKDDMRQNGFIR